jgi:hypothetical protein
LLHEEDVYVVIKDSPFGRQGCRLRLIGNDVQALSISCRNIIVLDAVYRNPYSGVRTLYECNSGDNLSLVSWGELIGSDTNEI